MAKFVTADGKEGISGDKFMDEIYGKNNRVGSSGIITFKNQTAFNGYDGRKVNLCKKYYLILEMITNEDHRCINMNETIQQRIRLFASQYIDDAFRMKYPRLKIRVKTGDGPFDFKLVDETDDAWFDRLCHMYMHKNHPAKLQMIKCEECLQHWMNDDKW